MENVFKDLGFPNPDEELLKVRFATLIYNIITKRGLKRGEASNILGISKSDLSTILKGRLADCSIDQLLSLLGKLDHDIEIVLQQKTSRWTTHIHLH